MPAPVSRAIPDLFDVTRCPDEPVMPPGFADDRQAALWISRALEAGEECRAAFRAGREWVVNPPKVK